MTIPHLPILIRSGRAHAEGFVGKTPVRGIPAAWSEVAAREFESAPPAALKSKERRMLRGIVQLLDAASHNKPNKLNDVAISIAQLRNLPDVATLDQILQEPFEYARLRIAEGCGGASLVLWLDLRGKTHLGIQCRERIEAFYVLLMFKIGAGGMKPSGECKVCGASFEHRRGTRKTCSDKCRAALSRKTRSK